MNIDRYIAIAHPFFHKAWITKRRIATFMIITKVIFPIVTLLDLISYIKKTIHVFVGIELVVLLCLMIFMNFRMFVIARNKWRRTPGNTRPASGLSKNYTCMLVIACFFVCSTPLIVWSTFLVFDQNLMRNKDFHMTLKLWTSSIATMNSSFNCVILFKKMKGLEIRR